MTKHAFEAVLQLKRHFFPRKADTLDNLPEPDIRGHYVMANHYGKPNVPKSET